MKNIVISITVIFIISNTFAQGLTDLEYNKLSDLFAIDIQRMSETNDTYIRSKLISGIMYSQSTVFNIPKNTSSASEIDKILIIANSSIFTQVESRIKRYAYDINYAYGCNVIIKSVSGGEHTDIKNIILSESNNLDGVVLIGDIPVAWYEIDKELNDDDYGHTEWPCDFYYMDLDGIWEDIDNDGIFDKRSGNYSAPEIFVGRISTANMGTLITEKEGLEDYFDKNHKFWIGKLKINKKYGLSYIDSDWDNQYDFMTSMKYVYGINNCDIILEKDYSSFGKEDYLNRLSNNKYEFIHLASHSHYEHHYLNGSIIYANEIFNNSIEAIGYNLFCCYACRWTSVAPNSTRGFLGGTYIYNKNNSGLVLIGSTNSGSMLGFDDFYTPLGEGDCFGQALVKWWIDHCGSAHGDYEIAWYYGLSIIGDPLINLYQCTYETCEDEITLNYFDNSNTSDIRYHNAKNKITINPNSKYIIPSGKHVIFNSPSIDILKNLKCESGGSFDIISNGCNSNCP